MSPNVIELMESVIADAQTLLNELGEYERAQQRISGILNAAQAIQTELKLYAAADGSIECVPRSSGSYTRTPFAIFETGVYLTKHLGIHGAFPVSSEQIERLERMDARVKTVINRLDEIWQIE